MQTDGDRETLHRAMLAAARENFELFGLMAFKVLNDERYMHNWHIAAIAHQLTRLASGKIRRLIITMPPRTMKSFIASVCYVAWLLGKNPREKIICASYAQTLSNDFAFQMRRLMESSWYQDVFPETRIDPRKSGLEEIRTTRGGYRLSTSVGGSLTGRGATFIIIDDPIKAADAHSEPERKRVDDWFGGTVSSRLDNPQQGRIVVVAQRLHMEDLPGQLSAQKGWHHLNLPLIAPTAQDIPIDRTGVWRRNAGDVLHPERFDARVIADLRQSLGKDAFEAQYNQQPLPPGGAIFKLEWLQRYERRPHVHQIQGIFQSWDTAYEVAGNNDYSVCTTWAMCGNDLYLLDVYRARLTFPQLEQAVHKLRRKLFADLVIVEKAGAGMSVYQNIWSQGQAHWLQYTQPKGSKQDRASQQSTKFARGRIYLPTEAPWLKAYENELALFPHGKFDDQVDSTVQFLAAVDAGRLIQLKDIARAF